jgi:hypothetical protein
MIRSRTSTHLLAVALRAMRTRLGIAAVLSLAILAAAAAPAQAGDVTIMFGRGQLEQVDSQCRPMANTVDLWTIANDLRRRGMAATVPVTASQIGTTNHVCTGNALYPTWSDLASFRDDYGWSMIPRGRTNASLKTVTDPAVLDANVCGSLQALYDHGHMRAWGMYAWPQNRWTLDQEQTYVPRCFAFGRRYAGAGTSNPLPVEAPYYWARTISVNGGRCADTTLACHTMTVRNDRSYMQPSTLIRTGARSGSGYWTIFQWYRLVTGSHGRPGDTIAWSCSSSNPAQHWTSYAEIYCYNDYQTVIGSLDPTRVTDPAGVALELGIDKAP